MESQINGHREFTFLTQDLLSKMWLYATIITTCESVSNKNLQRVSNKNLRVSNGRDFIKHDSEHTDS